MCGNVFFEFYFFLHGDDKIRKLIIFVIFGADEQEKVAYEDKVVDCLKRRLAF